MAAPEIALFDQIAHTAPPENPAILIDTACVLGGSVAGLFAARVLADHARQVVVIEQDELGAGARRGVPQGPQYHLLLAVGALWADRWFPGFLDFAAQRGAVLAPASAVNFYFEDRRQAPAEVRPSPLLTRPMLEDGLREKVLALPNVSLVHGRATGLDYHGGGVSAVRYTENDVTRALPADFVVDAMGRASRLSDWLTGHGFDRPPLERVRTGINYATARFKRPARADDLDAVFTSVRSSRPELMDGAVLGVVSVVEDDQWQLGFMGYGESRPGRTTDEMAALAARLPPPFPDAVADGPVGDVATFHHADSRRRDFTAVTRFPARLVSVGDSVASFNPIFGQGMSSAVLHASCLARYLRAEPDLGAMATEFFRMQKVVVDAAWTLSSGADIQRQEAHDGVVPPPQVRAQRAAMADVVAATLVDPAVSTAFRRVTTMLAHPGTLADPEIQARAAAAKDR